MTTFSNPTVRILNFVGTPNVWPQYKIFWLTIAECSMNTYATVALNQQYMNTGHMCHNEGKGTVISVYIMEVYSGRRGIFVPMADGVGRVA